MYHRRIPWELPEFICGMFWGHIDNNFLNMQSDYTQRSVKWLHSNICLARFGSYFLLIIKGNTCNFIWEKGKQVLTLWKS